MEQMSRLLVIILAFPAGAGNAASLKLEQRLGSGQLEMKR